MRTWTKINGLESLEDGFDGPLCLLDLEKTPALRAPDKFAAYFELCRLAGELGHWKSSPTCVSDMKVWVTDLMLKAARELDESLCEAINVSRARRVLEMVAVLIA